MKICPACSREYPSESTHCLDDGVALVILRAEGQGRPEELIGHIVDGRYRVEKIIGRGGMGVVYACRHVVVNKPAAMKVLRIGDERAEGVLQRFIREAQTANVVRSRHIVEMTDFGQLPNGYCYVVMELLEGMSLTQAMRENRLSRPDLLHVFAQMAEALDLVHAQGIVHRDLKPDNVFLVNEANDPLFVKLLDFGIAKAVHAQVSGLTETGVILGTPYYMSPEQARGENVDHRTDIYALGVMMYRAFTGKLPFVAESMLGVLTRHLTEVPAPPSHITQIDGRIEHVILRCLEKDPNARFQTAGEVAAALRSIATERPSAGGTQLMQHPGAPRASYQGNSMAPSYPPGISTPVPVQALEFSSPSGAFGAVSSPPTGGYAPAPGSYPPGTPVPAVVTSGLHASPAAYGSVPPAATVSSGISTPQGVPELVTQRGLATSSTGRIELPQKRHNALLVGLPVAILVAGVMIAVAILVSRGGSKPEGSATAAAASGVSEIATQTQPAPLVPSSVLPAASSAAPVAEPAPSAEPSAASVAEPSATEAPKTTRAPVYTRPAAPVKTSETPSKPAGKRPEIRSPFE
ncbi:MAG: protein kinase [Polyangiaceae bacterium]|nr:protein kinase [Polyangiaceae bacterium]